MYQVLDVHAPEGAEGRPVMIFIHGGAFHMSDKRDERYYPETGERLARAGFVAVLPNYRLTPTVRYPAHAEDIAAAVAWTMDHIAEYGGDPTRIFIAGHSAGGFLAAAVSLDRRFLERHDRTPDAIRGVIPICGQFEVVDSGRQDTFGVDDGRWPSFSPRSYVRADAPPFLILEAVRDDWWAPGQAEDFRQSLLELNVTAEFHELDHDHFTIITQIGMERDPVVGLIRTFVERSLKRPAP
jgi:acetyl esterase/lipase